MVEIRGKKRRRDNIREIRSSGRRRKAWLEDTEEDLRTWESEFGEEWHSPETSVQQ